MRLGTEDRRQTLSAACRRVRPPDRADACQAHPTRGYSFLVRTVAIILGQLWGTSEIGAAQEICTSSLGG